MQNLREMFENNQIAIYFAAVLLAVITAFAIPTTSVLHYGINPALGLMLFVTFLQVPLVDLGRAFKRIKFIVALLITNFVVLPLLVTLLLLFLPANPMIRVGVLMVLLTPCIDYVVTFSHLGRADARSLLAATPLLLIVQLLLLPVYLGVLLGTEARALVQPEPFVDAFIWLIAVPFIFAVAIQMMASRNPLFTKASQVFSTLPVPATALVLFMVVAAMLPQLGPVASMAFSVVPFYIAFAIVAPLAGWAVSRLFQLDAFTGRAIAFSAGTRNSLVILPLALAIPGAVPILPAIIVTQTLVELISELCYIHFIAKLGGNRSDELDS